MVTTKPPLEKYSAHTEGSNRVRGEGSGGGVDTQRTCTHPSTYSFGSFEDSEATSASSDWNAKERLRSRVKHKPTFVDEPQIPLADVSFSLVEAQ